MFLHGCREYEHSILWLFTKHFLAESLPQIQITYSQTLRWYKLSILHLKFWCLQIMGYSHRYYWLEISIFMWMWIFLDVCTYTTRERDTCRSQKTTSDHLESGHQVISSRWCELPNLSPGSWVWVLFKDQQVLLTHEPTLLLYSPPCVKGVFMYLFTYFIMCMFMYLNVCKRSY